MKIKSTWITWIVMTLIFSIYLAFRLFGDDKQLYSPGEMTHGHHQIEMSCATCHTDAFGGGPVIQDSCVNCHGEELKQVDDSHPKSKFTDPRNISRVKELDARLCITCHTEHKTEITGKMGLTIPEDFCFKCHQDIADDRPSHAGMDFVTCSTSGCHNYHDNKALYEDFLEKHIDEKNHLAQVKVLQKSMANDLAMLEQYPLEKYPLKQLTSSDTDSPIKVKNDPLITEDWSMTAHAQAGVNCTACHEQKMESGEIKWINEPDHNSCKTCHTTEVKGFLEGKHGMRLNAGLTPMKPSLARIPMKSGAHDKELSCTSCHSSHKFDVKHAAVEACLTCHDDKHSLAYKDSPHFLTWHKEVTGRSQPGTGVSCSTCHMPRQMQKIEGHSLVLVEHNQNLNLRPNEKMLRSVCMNCHGLEFAIDSLADNKLIDNNFSSAPGVHVESMDLVRKRLEQKKRKEGDGL